MVDLAVPIRPGACSRSPGKRSEGGRSVKFLYFHFEPICDSGALRRQSRRLIGLTRPPAGRFRALRGAGRTRGRSPLGKPASALDTLREGTGKLVGATATKPPPPCRR
jgi:hypothetical protein